MNKFLDEIKETIENQQDFEAMREIFLQKWIWDELDLPTSDRILRKVYEIGYYQGRMEGEHYERITQLHKRTTQ